jgi:hypothetical protein
MTSVDSPRFGPYLADGRWLALASLVITNGTTMAFTTDTGEMFGLQHPFHTPGGG